MADLQRPALLLFQEWLESNPSPDQASFDALCAAHPELEDELAELKADRDRQDSLRLLEMGGKLVEHLETPTEPDPGEEGAASDVTTSSDLAAELLARLSGRGAGSTRYLVKDEVARGGMGAVLRVWDDDLRRHLAMKVMLDREHALGTPSPEDSDPHTLGRFLEEAQITGQLQHPGIVPVHDLGIDADGQIYFTMKLVKGQTLREVFAESASGEGGWNRERVLGVILKVCEAMSYAHDRGVIHRDLKPANVMVGRHGEVYVMDWGVARMLGQPDRRDLRPKVEAADSLTKVSTDRRAHARQDPDSQLRTMDGAILGTPAYMSVEQAMGDLAAIGPHSDVYAVGAMLYHLLAGHMPYVTPGSKASSYMVLRWVQEGPPLPLGQVSPDTPAELVAICEKAMTREAEQRYPDMGALAEDLAAYMEGRVVAAHQTGAWAEVRKWVQRNRGLAACGALAVALLVAGIVATTWLREQALTSYERASEQERIATERLSDLLSLSAAHDLEELTGRAEQLWPARPELIPHLEAWISDAAVLRDGRAGDRERGLRARPSLAEHKLELSKLSAKAVPQTDPSILQRARAHAAQPDLAAARDERAWQARMLGLEPWPDERDLEAALSSEELPDEAVALDGLARPLVDPTAPRHGEELRALLIARRALELSSEQDRAAILDTLAWALYRTGRLEEALSTGGQAAAADDSYSGSNAALAAEVERWQEGVREGRRAELAQLEERIRDLELEVGERVFANPEDAWWWRRLRTLVADIEALHDPRTGLAGSTVSEPFGWGVARRLEFARTIEARSVEGPAARAKWAEAHAAIRASGKYGGLELPPQLGLLPLGEDPSSGLWEFAHLQTGEPPVRGADGALALTEETGLVLVLIPRATFTVGAQKDDPTEVCYDPEAEEQEGPPHEVTLSPYFLSKYEMTQGQWERVTGVNPSRWGPSRYQTPYDREGEGWSPLHPVESVSWTDCQDLMERLSLSLPSEAQWEHGCRAGTTSVYWTGEEPASLEGSANVRDHFAASLADWDAGEAFDDGHLLHARVGSYRGNALGLHDTHGNVWEWALDGYVEDAYGSRRATDPVVPWSGSNTRTVRGGSFFEDARESRAAYRFAYETEIRSETLGLRPARPLDL